MRIIHITNNDYDGAGRLVLRLHKQLLSLKIHSFVLLKHKYSNIENVIEINSINTTHIYGSRSRWFIFLEGPIKLYYYLLAILSRIYQKLLFIFLLK